MKKTVIHFGCIFPRLFALVCIFGCFLSCSRTGTDKGLDIKITSIRQKKLQSGAIEETRLPAEGARVYLVDSSEFSDPTSAASYVTTDLNGFVSLPLKEGLFNVFVDRDGDSTIDKRVLGVHTGQKIEILVFYSIEITDTAKDSTDNTKRPDEPVLAPILRSLSINSNAAETSTYDVGVTVDAENVLFLQFTESPPSYSAKIPFANSFGYQLSAGQGSKTLWAIGFGTDGSISGPVSATTTVKGRPPYPPILSKLSVLTSPPGSNDFLAGEPGAVEGANRVRVYADPTILTLIGESVASVDGSIPKFSIGDGSATQPFSNVHKPMDWVYVTNVDVFDRESVAVFITNDSTPPSLFPDQLSAGWIVDSLAPQVGNRNDILRVWFSPSFFEPSVFGGLLNYTPLGGNSPVPFSGQSVFSVDFTVPNDAQFDARSPVKAKIWDAALNTSEWIYSLDEFSVNTASPVPVIINAHRGGNRQFQLKWTDPNYDGEFYSVIVKDETQAVVYSSTISALEYACYVGGAGFSCFPNYALQNNPYWDISLSNCHWYTVQISVLDAGWNVSPYSAPVSARVILPPPSLAAWGGLSDLSGMGALYFKLGAVLHASAYELDFSLLSGSPYAYQNTQTVNSPFLFASYPVTTSTLSLDLPKGERYFLSTRAFDGACRSDYSTEISAATDLQLLTYADGATSYQSIGGALAFAGSNSQPKVVIGAARAQKLATLDVTSSTLSNYWGYFHAPEDYDIPGTPLTAINLDSDLGYELIVGSPLDSPSGIFLAGTVSVYDDNGTLIGSIEGDAEGLQLGHVTVGTDDLNLNGTPDFLVGSLGCLHRDCLWPVGSSISAPEGPSQVRLYDGATLSLIREHEGMRGQIFGASIATGYDFDGDNIIDYIVGAPGAAGHSKESNVYVYSGATGALIASISGVGLGNNRLGSAVSGIPDLNGDGIPDLVVGAPSDSDNGYGAVIIFTSFGGNMEPLHFEVAWGVSGETVFAGPRFGASIAVSSDLDGDGEPDILVGSPGSIQNYYYGAGKVFAVSSKTRLVSYEIRGKDFDGGLGYSLLIPPDLNGLPRPEWVIGAPGSAYSGYQSGRVYIFTTDL